MLGDRSTGGISACAALLVGWALCAAPAPGGQATTMEPPEDPSFTRGPALQPAAAALAYLDRLGNEERGKRVRVPVALALDEERLAIVEARLGRGDDAPRLRLDDARLGISLLDRARDLCPKAGPCVLRLVGYWRGTSEGIGRLEVLRVDGPARPAAREVVEIEGTTGSGGLVQGERSVTAAPQGTRR
jgi:hypothetical protein